MASLKLAWDRSAHLMMLAFLIYQIQLRCCAVFNAARKSVHSRSRL
ncbi:MAG: hypothetical protein OXG56_12380 [Gammaproteobacteria bacterium]|nr:hypothetical protein [Gammaproteobacteria bacterium]